MTPPAARETFVTMQAIPVATAKQLTAAAVLVRFRGELKVTAIVKVTLAFAPNGQMPLAPPTAIVREDAHLGKNPLRSLRAASELAPYLTRAEVTFHGSAFAPGGEPTPRMTVRVGVADDRGAVLDKRLEIVGDRTAATMDRPAPFKEMPLVWERAYGGLGCMENLMGVGYGDDATALPNVLYPEHGRATTPAGLGPVAGVWPRRKRKLRGKPAPGLNKPIVELADDFDWTFFQSAPEDQQLDALPQRAWIVLEGLNAKNPFLHMRLPPMRVGARLHGVPGDPVMVLRADALHLDGAAEQATVCFRGAFSVPSEAALEGAWLAAAIEAPGQAFEWPDKPTAPVAAAPPGIDPARFAGTQIIDDPSPPPPAKGRPFAGTLDDAHLPPAQLSATLPFAHAGPSEDHAPAPRSEPAAAIPGAPWAGAVAARPAPAPRPGFDSTIAVDELDGPVAAPTPFVAAPPAPPPPPVEPPPARAPIVTSSPVAPAAPAPAPVAERRADPYKPADPAEAPVVAPKAPAPKTVQGPAAPPPVNKGLYGKFGGKR